MTDAVKALPTFTHVRAFRPTGAYPIFVHSTVGRLIHALNQKRESFCFFYYLPPVRVIVAEYVYDIYLRGIGVTLVSALKKGYLITRSGLESVVTVLRQSVALIHLQPTYIDIHADEFSHSSTRKDKKNDRVD